MIYQVFLGEVGRRVQRPPGMDVGLRQFIYTNMRFRKDNERERASNFRMIFPDGEQRVVVCSIERRDKERRAS